MNLDDILEIRRSCSANLVKVISKCEGKIAAVGPRSYWDLEVCRQGVSLQPCRHGSPFAWYYTETCPILARDAGTLSFRVRSELHGYTQGVEATR